MGGPRIEKAKEALSLFIRSLPLGCQFTVLSFGSRYSQIKDGESEVIEYSERTRDMALAQIDTFSADHGGTNINEPMGMA